MSCAGVREQLVQCLLESPCIKRDHKTANQCLQPEEDVPEACRTLQHLFFECKRGQLDMRNRFRGNKNAL